MWVLIHHLTVSNYLLLIWLGGYWWFTFNTSLLSHVEIVKRLHHKCGTSHYLKVNWVFVSYIMKQSSHLSTLLIMKYVWRDVGIRKAIKLRNDNIPELQNILLKLHMIEKRSGVMHSLSAWITHYHVISALTSILSVLIIGPCLVAKKAKLPFLQSR